MRKYDINGVLISINMTLSPRCEYVCVLVVGFGYRFDSYRLIDENDEFIGDMKIY